MGCHPAHVPDHLVAAVLLLNGQCGKAFVLLDEIVEKLVAANTGRHRLELDVVPLLGEHLLDLGAGAPAEDAGVDVRAGGAHEDAVGEAGVRGLGVVAVDTELVVRVSLQEASQVGTEGLGLREGRGLEAGVL